MEKFAQTSHALLPVGHWCPVGNAVGMFSPDYLAEPLTPYSLPTKDGGCSAPLVTPAPTCLLYRKSVRGVITGSPRIGYSYTVREPRR